MAVTEDTPFATGVCCFAGEVGCLMGLATAAFAAAAADVMEEAELVEAGLCADVDDEARDDVDPAMR